MRASFRKTDTDPLGPRFKQPPEQTHRTGNHRSLRARRRRVATPAVIGGLQRESDTLRAHLLCDLLHEGLEVGVHRGRPRGPSRRRGFCCARRSSGWMGSSLWRVTSGGTEAPEPHTAAAAPPTSPASSRPGPRARAMLPNAERSGALAKRSQRQGLGGAAAGPRKGDTQPPPTPSPHMVQREA